MKTPRIIGFDVRDGTPPELGLAYREQYLLKPEINMPLSVDRRIWPSVAKGAGDWYFDAFDLWDEVGKIVRPRESDWSIAIASTAEREVAVDIPPVGRLLGYDIADAYMTSGLCNCGYDASIREAWRMRWSPRLNEHGLFADLAAADAFREATDDRVREHRPFFIFAICRL